MKHKITAALIFVIVATIVLSGCTDKFAHNQNSTKFTQQIQSEDNSQNNESNTNPLEQARLAAQACVDSLPADAFDGTVIKITATSPELFVPKMDGGIVDTALYYRNKMLEEKYNLKIDVVAVSNISTLKSQLKRANLAQQYYTDFVSVPMNEFSGLIYDKSLYDINKLPFMDFKADYMQDTLYDTMNLNGSLYCLFGSALQQANYTYACFFNKDLLDKRVESPYSLCKNGQWTWDALINYPLVVFDEQQTRFQGKEVLEPGYAKFGSFSDRENYFNAVFESGDLNYLTAGADGLLQMDYKTKSANVLAQLFADIMVEKNVYRVPPEEYADEYSAFVAGKLAFMPAKLSLAQDLSYSGVNYGVTSMPKFYTSQQSYEGWIENTMPGIAVPAYCSNTHVTGSVLNCFYAASHEYIKKAQELEYINTCLPDNDSALAVNSIMSYGKTDISLMLGKQYTKVADATYKVWNRCIYDGVNFYDEYSKAQEKYSDYLKGIK